jgi:hypothetical protein
MDNDLIRSWTMQYDVPQLTPSGEIPTDEAFGVSRVTDVRATKKDMVVVSIVLVGSFL